jgi:hypothetical protein
MTTIPRSNPTRSARRSPVLKPMYSVAELADLAQMTPTAMRRYLRKKQLISSERGKRGEKVLIALCLFKKACPELWDSIQLVEQYAA